MTSDAYSSALVEHCIPARAENGNRPTAPRGRIYTSVRSYQHAVGITLGAEPLHHTARCKVDHRERVAKILRRIESSSIGRDRNSSWIPDSVFPCRLHGQNNAVRELRRAIAPVEPVDHILIAARDVQRAPIGAERQPKE